MKNILIRYLLSWLLLLCGSQVFASSLPVGMPADTKLVTFRYDPNNTYTVYSRPMAVTHVQLGSDERVTAFALGDTVQWVTEQSDSNLFIKPIRPDISTSATLVTNKRTYQLTLKSVGEKDKWYQRVTWQYPDLLIRQQQAIAVEQQIREEKVVAKEREVADAPPPVTLEKLNFEYEVKGSGSFKPTQVFDDGKFTWFRIAPSQQDLPVFFIINEGRTELANYIVKGEFVVIQRLFAEAVLRLAKEEVRVINKRRPSRSTSVLGLPVFND